MKPRYPYISPPDGYNPWEEEDDERTEEERQQDEQRGRLEPEERQGIAGQGLDFREYTI